MDQRKERREREEKEMRETEQCHDRDVKYGSDGMAVVWFGMDWYRNYMQSSMTNLISMMTVV